MFIFLKIMRISEILCFEQSIGLNCVYQIIEIEYKVFTYLDIELLVDRKT
jgi:hypothetical protein